MARSSCAYADESPPTTWIELTVDRGDPRRRSLVYAYERELDHVGHVARLRIESLAAAADAAIDEQCERLRDALPDDVRLIITGDHGMLDIPRTTRSSPRTSRC